MKTVVARSSVKVWFGFLKMAIRHGVPINQDVYSAWGTQEELAKLTFNKWWLTRGKALFESEAPKAKVVASTNLSVTIEIPTSLNSKQVKEQVSRLMTEQRGTKRLKVKPSLSFEGDVNYKTLKQYERLLEIDLNPKFAGESIEQKTERLREKYRDLMNAAKKRKETLRAKGNKRAALGIKYRDPNELQDYGDESVPFTSEAQIRKGVDPKKAGRWRVSGKILILNAAEGRFPGKDYYGNRIGSHLRSRLQALGLEDIGAIPRNKGGGQVREDLHMVRVRKSKKQRETDSLKAYGATKGRKVAGGLD